VFNRRDVLGPRLDAGFGDGSDVGCLRRDRDSDTTLFGDLSGDRSDLDGSQGYAFRLIKTNIPEGRTRGKNSCPSLTASIRSDRALGV